MMTYKKPDNVSYTDMAIWIDTNVYSGSFDEETLYIYLYLLCYMLTTHIGFFCYEQEKDEFSLFSASQLYNRLTNKKQFEFKSDGSPKMKKITSILNYIKNVLPRYKYDYDILFNGMSKDPSVEIVPSQVFNLDSYVSEYTCIFDQLSYAFTFQNLSGIIKQYLKKIPKKKNSSEWENIYISCVLTLLNTITLTKEQKHLLVKQKRNRRFLLEKLYRDLRNQPPILFHLDNSYSNYIQTLVNELRNVLSMEISWKDNSYITNTSTMESMLMSSYKDEELE